MSDDEGTLTERFEEFLRSYKDDQGNLVYWTKIQSFSEMNATSLVVDFRDLTVFDHVIFSTLARDSPMHFLETLDAVLRSILRTEDPNYLHSIDEQLIRVQLIEFPNAVNVRDISSKDIGTLVRIDGIVANVGQITPVLIDGTFKCRRCGELMYQPQGLRTYMEPDLCPVCGKKTPVDLIPSKSTFINQQEGKIVDLWNNAVGGKSIDMILRGGLAGAIRKGAKVSVTAMVSIASSSIRQVKAMPILLVQGVRLIEESPLSRAQEVQTEFNSEEELEDLLQKLPELLEYGCRVVGRQLNTPVGRLDLLLEVPDGAKVVVELKNDIANDTVIGQISRYLVWASQEYPGTKIRGIIVARGFDEKMLSALRACRFHVRLIEISTLIENLSLVSSR